MNNWLLAIRPKTLTAAVVPVFVGTALALSADKSYSLMNVGLILSAAICIQIATNLINDAIDFHKGADTSERLGPVRVTQSGLITSKQVLAGGLLFLFLAMLLGVPLVLQAGWPILAVGAVSMFLAYSYTGGPFPLAYLGLGDLFVFIFFGLVAVAGTHYISSHDIPVSALVAGAQMGCLATILIAINNLRDVKGDALANKKTLAVRFGVRFVKAEIFVLLTATFLLSGFWVSHGHLWAGVLPLLCLPLAVKLWLRIFEREPSEIYNIFLAQSAALHAVFGLLLAMGLMIS